MIRPEVVNVYVAGDSGSATGHTICAGLVRSIHIDYVGQPSTCKVTVSTEGQIGGVPSRELLQINNSNTSAWYNPYVTAHHIRGMEMTEAITLIPIHNAITVTVTDGDSGEVTVTVLYETGA